ncbi:hypothetical protein C8R44DRAFT_865421 [Mycena epipterygia]|nr:hypothetical protein C8R44DRAFT_865421 [Mycena epipterygia]
MAFIDLPEDVVLDVLGICEVSSVLSISQTSKYLHLLVFTPTLWMSLVEDLRHRGFVDRLSSADIRSMSTQSLVALVKRMVVGPEAWSPPKTLSRPKSFSRIVNTLANTRERKAASSPQVQACTHIVLHPPIRPGLLPPYRGTFKLLLGGKYVLFCFRNAQDEPVLGCWRVADDSLLGTYRSGLPPQNIYDFDAEVLDGGESANIVMYVRTGTFDPYLVEVISWDFATGITELLSVTECPHSQFRTLPPIICGDFALVQMYHQSLLADIYAIIDWRAQKYCKILYPSPNGSFRMELIPGYVVLTWLAGRKTQELRVVALASLSASQWTPVAQRNTADPVSLWNKPHVAETVKSQGGTIRPGVTMEVHQSPLQRDTYRLWLSIPYSATRVPGAATKRALLCSFRLSLPGADNRKLTLQRRTCAPTAPDAPNAGISGIAYSGHRKARLGDAGTHRIFPPDRVHSAPITLQIPEAWWSAALVPYSGAVGYITAQTFVLSYFE